MAKAGSNGLQPGTVTRLLRQVREGSRSAFDELVPLVYNQLREMAQLQRRRWHGDPTLDTTELVHEAYLRLAGKNSQQWADRAHFFAVAATAMRQILIDYARRKQRRKRGGDQVHVSLDERRVPSPAGELSGEQAEALLALNEALRRLEEVGHRQSRVVECRFFGSMTIADTAAALNMSPATVKRDWAMAKAWLYRDMQRSLGA